MHRCPRVVSPPPSRCRDGCRAALALATTIAATACTPSAAPELPQRLIGCTEQVLSRLHFGLDTPRGPVGEAGWQEFVDRVVTPRFAVGLTVLQASGPRRDAPAGSGREPSRVVEIVHPPSAALQQRLVEIVGSYQARFSQRPVLVTQTPVRACL